MLFCYLSIICPIYYIFLQIYYIFIPNTKFRKISFDICHFKLNSENSFDNLSIDLSAARLEIAKDVTG